MKSKHRSYMKMRIKFIDEGVFQVARCMLEMKSCIYNSLLESYYNNCTQCMFSLRTKPEKLRLDMAWF